MKTPKGWQTDEVVKRVKGPKGTTVDISIRRPGVDQLIDLTVERDEINITTVRTAFMIAPGTGYVRLQDFSETTDTELGAALKKLKAAGMQRLRARPPRQPRRAARPGDRRREPLPASGPDDRLHARPRRELRRGLPRRRRRATTPTCRSSCSSNRSSASASEIVTGAMQDHDRGSSSARRRSARRSCSRSTRSQRRGPGADDRRTTTRRAAG